MKTHKSLKRLITPSLAVALGVAVMAPAMASPYATCLTNTAGTVSFRINESGGTVAVIGNGGALSNYLGVINRGLTVTNLSSTGMTGGAFQVVVTKAGSGVPTLISDNNNVLNKFFSPRGVAVNRRPASPYFGRVYVGENGGATAGGTRTTTDGIYILTADSSDAVGQGNTGLQGGIAAWDSTSMPWRVTVGVDDDLVYISDYTDAHGNLFRVDQNASAGSGTAMLKPLVSNGVVPVTSANNHGSLEDAIVTGSLGAGTLTLWTVDEDYQTDPDAGSMYEVNSLWRYDLGSANSGLDIPWPNAPVKVADAPALGYAQNVMGLDRATNGYFYFVQTRSTGAQDCLSVLDSTGAVLWKSRQPWLDLGYPRDWFSNCVSVAVSSDMKYMAALRAAGQVVVVPLVDGIPNLAGYMEFVGAGTSRQIAFDAADNIYLVSNSSERMRAYSLGLTTTATTGSNPAGNGGEGGSFGLATPSTSVSIAADTATLSEAGPTTATFTLTRAGDTTANPLTVAFATTGTAARGSDYVLQTNSVTFTGNSVVIPAGADSLTITLIVTDDAAAELTETATLGVTGTTFYSTGIPASATVSILDNEAPAADLTVVQASMYEPLTYDYARLRVVRRGDLNASSFTVNLTYTGTAAPARYTAPATVIIDPGVVNQNFDITPNNDSLLQGNQTIIANVASGSGYTVGTNSPTATATIVDDEVSSETVLFADNFDTDNSANWTIRFAARNGVDDYRLSWALDYSLEGIPPAPHSPGASTIGLKMSVNKDESSAGGGAGLNLYPNNKSFSDSYALRFDMYLKVGNAASTTEYALLGINHSGTKTNWFRGPSAANTPNDGVGGSWSYDGVWASIEADASGTDDYMLMSAPAILSSGIWGPTTYAAQGATPFAGLFKAPPFFLAGSPANSEISTTPSWADVELSQVGNVVTLKVDKNLILSYTNTVASTSGNIMVGYLDAYDSIMAGDSSVYIDNLRVVKLGVQITNIQIVGGQVQVNFTWGLDDPTSAFKLQKSNLANAAYADDATATITKVSPGVYQATTAYAAGNVFFRIKR